MVLIAAVAASFLLARNGDRIEATSLPDTLQAVPVAQPATPAAPVAPAPSAAPIMDAPAPTADVASPQELVTLHVTTRPSGAKLRLASGGELCGRTPCSFEVVRGAQISLLARFGQRRATTTLTPQATADVHIVLDAPSPTKGERLNAEHAPLERSHDEATHEVAVDDDFKTPEEFK
jgi:hypothetical protein